ncbi:MAG: Gfo/Idh/MocA family oxidoreductase [Opitutaceae bacterium]
MNRRNFLKTTSAVSAGAFILPRFSIGQPGPSANSKLNIAMIGAGNIAAMAYGGCKGNNIVALADVDSQMFLQHKEKHPEVATAKHFTDFREMLDKMDKDIDAVCINTPDHTHFVATMHAMEMGKHVCTQKPLTHNIWQAQTLKKAKDKYGVVTNMAVQGHTYNGIRQMKEWYEADVFGQIREVHAWKNGPGIWPLKEPGKNGYFHSPESFPPPVHPIPDHLNWDLWLGPNSGDTTFNNTYHPKSWRGYHAFGNGTFGDWFPHVADAAIWVLDLYEPVVVEVENVIEGNEWMVPKGNTVRWEFKQRGNKAPCTFRWTNGPYETLPKPPKEWTWGEKFDKEGTLFFGDKQTGFTDPRSNNPILADKEAMREFKKAGYPAEKYPRLRGGPFKEWVNAIKDDGPEPGANFDFASPFTEVMLLGVLATKVGGRIEWDPKKGITNRPELNAFIKEPVRKGWEYGEDLWT